MKNIVIKIIFLLLITHCSLLGQVKIGTGGNIESTGSHPPMFTSDVKGTPKNVADITTRDAIALNLREVGMFCYVVADNTVYQLQGGTLNINWVAYASGGGGVGVDTLSSYAQLRAYTGNSKTLFITDFTKVSTFDGLTYTTKGGLFYQVTAGTENGATIIAGAGGKKWARAYQLKNIDYQWFEVGGYTLTGALTGNHLTTNIGIWNDADRLQAAASLAGNYGTIDLGGNTVLVDHKITFADNQTVKNGVLKRIASPLTTLTASFGSAATTLSVTSAAGFRVGQLLLVTNPAATNGGYAFDENAGISSTLAISAISGTTITITQATGRTMASGCKVSCNIPIIAFDGNSVIFENVTFDGNGSMVNNGTNAQTRDWRLNLTGTIIAKYGSRFVKCVFQNIPSSNVQGGKIHYQNCTFIRLAGSIFHESIADRALFVGRQTLIENCNGDSLGIHSNIAAHEESLVTMSANPDNIKIIRNRFTNTFYTSGVINFNPQVTLDVSIEANYVEGIGSGATQRYCISGSLSGVDSNTMRVRIVENTFVNMGDIALSGNNLLTGYAYSGFLIDNNTFVNSRGYFLNVANSKITNNWFLTDTINGWTGWSTPLTSQNAYMMFQTCTGMDIKGNKILARSAIDNNVWSGICVLITASMTNDGVYYYPSNFDISDNTLYGFGAGITTHSYGNGTSACTFCYRSVNNWRIDNNIIISATGSIFEGHGILAMPGSIVTNNTIYWRSTTSGENPIFAYGVNDTTANRDKIIGPIIKNNTVYSAGNRSITLGAPGSGTAATTGTYHIVCSGNVVNKPIIRNFVTGTSIDTMNIVLNTTTFPAYTAPQTPPYKIWKPKKGLVDN